MIQTNEYALTKQDYLKILVLLRLKKSWGLLAGLILLAIYFFSEMGTDPMATFVVIFTVVYIPIVFLHLLYFVHAKDNRNIYRSRQLTFNADKIIAYSGQDTVFDTRTTSEVALSQIIRTKKVGDFWLLYVTKAQFIVIPKSIFRTPEDREGFKKLFNLK